MVEAVVAEEETRRLKEAEAVVEEVGAPSRRHEGPWLGGDLDVDLLA